MVRGLLTIRVRLPKKQLPGMRDMNAMEMVGIALSSKVDLSTSAHFNGHQIFKGGWRLLHRQTPTDSCHTVF